MSGTATLYNNFIFHTKRPCWAQYESCIGDPICWANLLGIDQTIQYQQPLSQSLKFALFMMAKDTTRFV